MPQRRPKEFPMFMGLPSPSLARINRMSQERLRTHVESLQRESIHILNKLERLKTITPSPTEKMDAMILLLARLRGLEKIARDRRPITREERVRAFLKNMGGPAEGN